MRLPLVQRARAGLRTRGFAACVTLIVLVAGLLSLYYLLKGKAFAFYDVGSDTWFCFYPLQVAVARQLHALHDVTWSWELGLGGFLGTLLDPLLLATGWLPESWQLGTRLPMFVFRLLAGGACFYAYLREIGLRSPAATVGGLGYAFSSYGLINAQWEVMHGTEFVQFAAFVFLLERFLRTRAAWCGVAAGFVVGIGHPLGLYMFALFGLVYAIVRLALTSDDRRSDLRAWFAFASWCLPGLALAAPLLLPATYYLLENPRVSGDHSQLSAILPTLRALIDRDTMIAQIGGLLGKDTLGSGAAYAGWANYFEGPGFYVGLLPLLALPQLFGPHATRREKRLAKVALAGCVIYFLWPALRYAVYGFGHMSFRFSTLWISALLLVLGVAGLQRALQSGWWPRGLAIGTAAIAGIIVLTAAWAPEKIGWDHVVRVVAFTTLYCVLIIATIETDLQRRAGGLLVVVCACELLVFAIPAVLDRDAVRNDGSTPSGSYHDATLQALDYVRSIDPDDGYYRIEKTYYSVFLADALVQNYPGTASYYFNGSSLTRFADRLNVARAAPSPNYISSMFGRYELLDLLAVKYLFARDRKLDAIAAMEHLGRFAGIEVYRNSAALTFASFRSEIASEADADAIVVPERDAWLLSHATVDDPDAVRSELARMPTGDASQALVQSASLRRSRDDRLDGRVQTPKPALLLLAMPYDRGWSAWLDQKPLRLLRADYGLTAALIPAGAHDLVLAYSPPGRQLGFSLMAGALAFLATIRWLSRRDEAAADRA
jgi:hypothetical protein